MKTKTHKSTSTHGILFKFMVFFLFCCQLQAQRINRTEFKDTMQRIPAFTIHEDNYFITGVPTNMAVNSRTANAKYQISFKQIISRNTLPWDSYAYLTYTQKAFWDIYQESYPFKEINFHPTVGVGRAFFDKNDELKGIGTFNFEHESNGRDSIFSRTWNRFSIGYHTAIGSKTVLSVKGWVPFGYKNGNPDLLDYVGLGELRLSYDFIPNRFSFEIKLRKGLQWDTRGMVRTRLYYRPFKNKGNQYFMLEWFAGHTENLINYERFTSMVRFGYVIKTIELDFLKSKN
ncbi:phospholipase A [Maribacter chungangensis]|uniref:Phosphatidylcholine 1-acylhydrolase n=1 Tax=Maribacter chungangensis TaxID=1069117 RepID=A0ABW3B590_9FLAO